ncbi:hypothetical protein VTK26DRAFT_937 [Humicola hyalothermophila]
MAGCTDHGEPISHPLLEKAPRQSNELTEPQTKVDPQDFAVCTAWRARDPRVTTIRASANRTAVETGALLDHRAFLTSHNRSGVETVISTK